MPLARAAASSYNETVNKGQILEAVRTALAETLAERRWTAAMLAKQLNVEPKRLYRIINRESRDVPLSLAIALFKLRDASMDEAFDLREPGPMDAAIDQAADLLLQRLLEKFSGVLRPADTEGTISKHPAPADEIIGTHRATQAPIETTDFDALHDAAKDLDEVADSDTDTREKEA